MFAVQPPRARLAGAFCWWLCLTYSQELAGTVIGFVLVSGLCVGSCLGLLISFFVE